MTAAPDPHSLTHTLGNPSRVRCWKQDGVTMSKYLAPSAPDHKTASRKWFSALLWRAFPSPSERDLSLKAARALDCSPRQVINWLRCENDAALSYVTAVMAIAGCEVIFGRIEGRK